MSPFKIISCNYELFCDCYYPHFSFYSADELLLTEMMFNGIFNDLTAEQATALLSCFVFQEKVNILAIDFLN